MSGNRRPCLSPYAPSSSSAQKGIVGYSNRIQPGKSFFPPRTGETPVRPTGVQLGQLTFYSHAVPAPRNANACIWFPCILRKYLATAARYFSGRSFSGASDGAGVVYFGGLQHE